MTASSDVLTLVQHTFTQRSGLAAAQLTRYCWSPNRLTAEWRYRWHLAAI